MTSGIRAISAGAVSVVAVAFAGTGCSSDKPPTLAKDCSAVFPGTATSAEGTCSGDDGTIHVSGADCHSGPRFMLAEHASSGEDYAWARVGSAWHLLTQDQTSSAAFRQCTG